MNNPFWVCSVLFCLLSALSLPYSYNWGASRQELWGVIACLTALYLWINTAHSETQARQFFYRCSWVLLPLAIICLFDQMTIHPEGRDHYVLFGHMIRYHRWEIHATLINSTVLSAFALSWIFFLVEESQIRTLAWFPLSTALTILFLARSAWSPIALLIGWLYFKWPETLQLFKKRPRTAAALAIFIIVLMGGVLRIKFGQERNIYYQGSDRLVWWITALRIWLAHPWFGVGLGAYETAYAFFKPGIVQSTRFAHSIFLQPLVETGLLGTSILAVSAGTLFRLFRKSAVRSSSTRSFTRCWIATLVALLTFCAVQIAAEYLLIRWMILLIIGAILVNGPLPRSSPVRKPWLLVALGVLITAFPFWLAPWQASRLAVDAYAWQHEGSTSKAQELLQSAHVMDPNQGEYSAALALYTKAEYERTRSSNAYTRWGLYLQESWRVLKSRRTQTERSDYLALHP